MCSRPSYSCAFIIKFEYAGQINLIISLFDVCEKMNNDTLSKLSSAKYNTSKFSKDIRVTQLKLDTLHQVISKSNLLKSGTLRRIYFRTNSETYFKKHLVGFQAFFIQKKEVNLLRFQMKS